RFSNETNSVPVLDAAFQNFASQGVTDLIVDLRYNGGGYVSTAEHLINLIAPSTANGVMYKELFNATMRDGKATIMKNQPILDENEKVRFTDGRMVNYFDDVDYSVAANTSSFNKAGNLNNVTNIVFIVSGSTASASELVINSLKPKMNVKLVGEQTYGKPVGFFPIRLENKYDVLYAMFETKNALDQGGYFAGMIPDFREENQASTFFDDPRYNFGDQNEPYTAIAIKTLNPSNAAVSLKSGGAVMVVNGKQVIFNSSSDMKPVKEDNGEFVGMIETRHKTKKH
ncbi:MAG TPA: S41 family peptidase, partial [Pedobacter sp.]|nr:S41 family peptidase [Pedobacter sp.]